MFGRLVRLIVLFSLLVVASCAPPPSPAETYRVGFMYADSHLDKGWNAAHWRGMQSLRQLGEVVSESDVGFTVRVPIGDGKTFKLLEVKAAEKVGYADADIERVLRSLIEGRAPVNMAFGTWWDSQYAFGRLADERPDVIFEHASSFPAQKSADHPNRNFATYMIRMEQGNWWLGKVTAEVGIREIGFVGTQTIPEVVRGINAEVLGMRSVTPDATAHVVWLYSWLNETAEREAAMGLLDVRVAKMKNILPEDRPPYAIQQLADTPTSSQAVCEAIQVEPYDQLNVVPIGYGTNVLPSAPCALVGASEWVWGGYVREQVMAALEGRWQPHDWFGGMVEGAVVLAGWDNVPDAIRWKMNAMNTVPFRGPFKVWGHDWEATVPAGKCLTDNTLLQMQFYVEGVDRESELPTLPPDGYVLEWEDC